jgi:hypothetical protein
MNTKRKEIVVVVHDAGGAEVIGAYMRTRLDKENYHAYGAGPAAPVFKRLKLPLTIIKDDPKEIAALMQKHAGSSYALIAAPGWMTKIEIRALLAAKRAGIRSIVYMDSWVNISKRFGYPKKGWQEKLPDEFWAGDEYALSDIRKEFPDIPVRSVPNRYFAEMRTRFKKLKRVAPKPDSLLFTSTIGADSRKLLSELLRALPPSSKLRIRYHPGDDRSRYDELIRSSGGRISVERSSEKDLVRDLLRAKAVIGTETTAMVVGILCNVRTISFVGRAIKPVLPFPQIERMSSLSGAAHRAAKAMGRKT